MPTKTDRTRLTIVLFCPSCNPYSPDRGRSATALCKPCFRAFLAWAGDRAHPEARCNTALATWMRIRSRGSAR